MTSTNIAKSESRPQTKVTREDWINVALKTLIDDGIEQVKIMILAKKLGVSRASFYWYFEDRNEILDELIKLWSQTNTKSILLQASKPAPNIVEAVANVFSCWMDIKSFNPRLDAAIRAWAHQDKKINLLVDDDDNNRLAAIKTMFLAHGYPQPEAFIRARVLYFMQIGYYALEIQESFETRFSYFELYVYSFTGVKPTKKQIKIAEKIVKSGSPDTQDTEHTLVHRGG